MRRAALPLAIALAVVGRLAADVRGDDLAALLNMTKESKTVPVWTAVPRAESYDLSEVVQRLHPSIFFVGSESVSHGTAFVISKENRLLATNAHVADIMYEAGGEMVAIANGTSKVYQVEKTYYHPGVYRREGQTIVRTMDPALGGVYPLSPDVAVLKLADGEELPAAIPLSKPNEVGHLLAKSVAMLGYPAFDNQSWPRLGEKVEATFREGAIVRVTDFTNDVNATDGRLQFVHHSLDNFGGFSGSPIFLRDGRVVALNNSGTTRQDRSIIASLSFGIRVDCLWECLKQHDLWDLVPVSADRESVDVERFNRPDATVAALNEVRQLVAMARIDVANRQEAAALDKAAQAEKLMPHYEPVFDVKCNAFTSYAINTLGDRSPEAQSYYAAALKAAVRAYELAPTSDDHLLDVAVAKMNLANSAAPLGTYLPDKDALKLAEEVLERENRVRDRDRAYAFRIRALAHGMPREALRDLERAVDADEWIPQNYATLKMYWNIHGDPAAAARADEKAKMLSTAFAESDQAWLNATSPEEDRRNGHEALRLATKACEATDFKWWRPLRSLAAAHAELGDFAKAAAYAGTAAEAAPREEAAAVRRQLASYKNNQPWREN